MKKACAPNRVYIAGRRGMVGSALDRFYSGQPNCEVFGKSSSELDLCKREQVFTEFGECLPDVVIDAAARVGGILANSTYPADFISVNLQIQTNLLDAAHSAGVKRFIFLGSSCIYPKFAPQPIPESALMTGPLEETNDAYAIAKIAGIMHVRAMRRQYGHRYVSAMPTNLYGPNDNFNPDTSHVIPALLRKFHEAAENSSREVVLWGTGTPKREFLHVDDLAAAVAFIADEYDDDEHINVGTGEDLTIADLAGLIAEIVGFNGNVRWDSSKPDGTPRKLLNVESLHNLGWRPQRSLEQGLRETYAWYIENLTSVRV